MIPLLSRAYLEILFPILLVRDPEVVPVEAVLIPVADNQGSLPRITMQSDMVGHEAVPQGVLWRALRLEVEWWQTLAVALCVLPGDVIRLNEQGRGKGSGFSNKH